MGRVAQGFAARYADRFARWAATRSAAPSRPRFSSRKARLRRSRRTCNLVRCLWAAMQLDIRRAFDSDDIAVFTRRGPCRLCAAVQRRNKPPPSTRPAIAVLGPGLFAGGVALEAGAHANLGQALTARIFNGQQRMRLELVRCDAAGAGDAVSRIAECCNERLDPCASRAPWRIRRSTSLACQPHSQKPTADSASE